MEPEFIHFEGSTMKYRRTPTFPVFVKGRGWTTTDQIRPGDLLSRHTFPPSYHKVVFPPPEDP